MRICFLGGLTLLISPALFAADTHCNTTEETVFSCNLGRKTVSLCASIPLTTQSGYLQYRFGAIGKAELNYPAKDVLPSTTIQARTLMFAGGGGAYVRVNRGEISYVIYTAIGKGWGTKEGLAVEQSGKMKAHWHCKNVPTSLLGTDFFARAGLTEDPQAFELP